MGHDKLKKFMVMALVLGAGFGGMLIPFTAQGATSTFEVEDWKGEPRASDLNLGAMVGMGIYGTQVGPSLQGRAAFKIVHHGFVPDINNQVFVEVGAGPTVVSAGTLFNYTAHLRWDFHLDTSWTFYATGGLGGAITSRSLGSLWTMGPRFATGIFYRITWPLSLRAEVANDVVVLGASFEL